MCGMMMADGNEKSEELNLTNASPQLILMSVLINLNRCLHEERNVVIRVSLGFCHTSTNSRSSEIL